ncbi:enoyl-CoA hydratase-related protein [Paenibacillus prosopidis]|uniref:Enoyl-CoA hydratase/carnithine racemase n=1 Tax=Paenibacillus prosopidis TaxID=630520 RepID=A0A368W891_9BACL|nr:enoyl-CoA hydratase-related protein [Paenibacillus prosopidis]RCW51951.1 enoyl-CoA hydratase/carnithine racemase [Paenibacillus prosopidis]
MSRPVLWEQHGHIGYIRLNRPEALNAINYDMLDALGEIVETIGQNPRDIRVVILGGEGRAFCSGADLKERIMLSEQQVRRNVQKIRKVFSLLERLPQPTIAAINGYAFGGGMELALCCDFRYSIREAKMGLTEASLGIIPGAGGTQRLPRLIGASKAKELILTARKISADQAFEIGLLNGVADDREQLKEMSEGLAAEILANAPLAVYQAKAAIDKGINTDLATGMDLEFKAYEATIATKDRLEALEAFREKRSPRFTGE